METLHIIGIDVSKKTVDVCCKTTAASAQFSNTEKGFSQLITWLGKQEINSLNCWFIFENTGMYSRPLVSFCSSRNIRYNMVPALEIKRSLGIKRGKSDAIDASNIAQFGCEKSARLKCNSPLNPNTDRLKRLLSLRDRFTTQRKGLLQSAKEMQEFCALKSDDIEIKTQMSVIKVLDKQIAKIEDQIKSILEGDQALKENLTLITSIKGIGLIVGAYILAYTNNFTRFEDSRKFACYIGTAPFPFSSGTSVRGRTKVSHLANKKLKSLLDLAAKSALQADTELNLYYRRRLQEGKSKMSTVNIIRNKLLHRVFAVVKRGTPYQIKAAA